jgi:hypothetical protein
MHEILTLRNVERTQRAARPRLGVQSEARSACNLTNKEPMLHAVHKQKLKKFLT